MTYCHPEPSQPKGVHKGIDQRIERDQHKMHISEPVNDVTVACAAQIHHENHDACWTIAGQERQQHHQVGLG